MILQALVGGAGYDLKAKAPKSPELLQSITHVLWMAHYRLTNNTAVALQNYTAASANGKRY